MASNNTTGGGSSKSKVHHQKGGHQPPPNPPDHDDDENQYFYEDEVFCIEKGRVKFGVVLDAEEGFEEDTLKKGELSACWHPDGQVQVVHKSKIGLADRTLMPGDVVRRMIKGKDTQRGYCHEILVKADVKIAGTKLVVRNVSSDRLRPLLSMPKDNAVCLDSWVGSTKNVNEKLMLKSQCGSLIEVRPDVDYCTLKDNDTRSRCGYFAGTLFYPGQTLVGPISELENAKWLNTSAEMKLSRKHKMVDRKFTVQSVEIEGVWVHWQCKASCEELATEMKENGIQQPPDYITGEDLKRLKKLNLFESCMLQINDKNYLKIEEGDSFCRKSLWRKELTAKYKKLMGSVKEEEQDELDEKVLCDNESHKITVTKLDAAKNSESGEKVETDRSKLCPSAGKDALAKLGKLRRSSPRRPNAASTAKLAESDEWQTDPEDEEDDDADGCDSNVSDGGGGGVSSSCSSTATPRGSPKKSPQLAKKIRKLRKRSTSASSEKYPAVGDEVITETLVVYSMATVVWQDGTIETNIPSTELCPIHHLDDHEFFPGDFVLAGNTDPLQNPSFRDYGVIQNVDHHGRTAKVKWFSTYTCADEPQPTFNGESEVSVYDLKDHPDFQYRPGTIVIRVANFNGDDSNCSAGQVIDNYPNGMVKVWWVDDHVSMCWPQDIFEVGQYDSENNFWGNNDSDNSWETEDETSELGGLSPQRVSKPKLTANLERARVAMARLEELFIINPHLQNQEMMRKLLMVYKKCRYLDRLMDTTFFHEEHFMGLVERVRKSNNQTTAERVLDQKNRLFNQSGSKTTTPTAETPSSEQKFPLSVAQASKKPASSPNPSSLNTTSSSFKFPTGNNLSTSSDISSIDENPAITTSTSSSKSGGECGGGAIGDDSGNFSSKSDGAESGRGEKNTAATERLNAELDNVNNLYMNISDDLNNTSSIFSFSPQAENVSAKLCSLIKAQLVKALQEINQRYSQEDPFKEIIIEEILLSPPPFSSQPVSSTPSQQPSNVGTPSVEQKDLNESNNEDSLAAASASAPGSEWNIGESFQVLETAPSTHKYHLTVFQTNNAQSFFRAVQREHRLLRTGLPPGVWVRTFEDRLDLLSVMIEGPKATPYEDGLFLFDIQLGQDYPSAPPMCHYISYCSDRLNPNLYEDGKVCVSLLGTWSGRGTEMWGPKSTLLQVIVSIQGLILVDEPYFNEAGYEKQRGSQQGKENSRMYNEMVLLKLVQSMTKLINNPPEIFSEQILAHFSVRGDGMYRRIKSWMDLSNEVNRKTPTCTSDSSTLSVPDTSADSTLSTVMPEFPLIPASRGFCLTLVGLLESFKKTLKTIDGGPTTNAVE